MRQFTKRTKVLAVICLNLLLAFVPYLNPAPRLAGSASKSSLIGLYVRRLMPSDPYGLNRYQQALLYDFLYSGSVTRVVLTILLASMGISFLLLILCAILLVLRESPKVYWYIRNIAISNGGTYVVAVILCLYLRAVGIGSLWIYELYDMRVSHPVGGYIGIVLSIALVIVTSRGEPVSERFTLSYSDKEAMEVVISRCREHASKFITEQKQKVQEDYANAKKEFVGIEREQILCGLKELCYRNCIIKYIMSYIPVILIVQSVVLGTMTLFGGPIYANMMVRNFISNTNLIFLIIAVLGLLKKDDKYVAIYLAMDVLYHLILYARYPQGIFFSFAWMNLMVLIVLEIYAVQILVKQKDSVQKYGKQTGQTQNIGDSFE